VDRHCPRGCDRAGRRDRREARTLVDAGLDAAVAAEAGAIEARAREVIARYF
jgi:hypothetical protein